MELNATTKAGPVDLLGSLTGNYFLTQQAGKSPDLRMCWGNPNQPSSPWRDYRFGGGLLAAGVGLFSSGATRRVAFGAANASLQSFVATEALRRVAMQRGQAQPSAYQMQPGFAPPQGQFGPPVYPQQQLPGPGAYAPQAQAQPVAFQVPQYLPGTFR